MSPSGGTTIPSGVEFPSQRRERIDWHKLASIDLHDLTLGCPIEVLQENLTQIAFCDAETEFDLGTVSGQRNLLKMFRLSQLTVQYLFMSQDFMETQLKEVQEEAQQLSEKYQQVKTKLLQQVEEAKKMKATNKNMRETVKQINSFAIANGIFQAVKCPQCPKTFRSSEFLQSHLWRKHPNQAASVTIPQAAPTIMPSPISPAHVTLVPSSATNHTIQGHTQGPMQGPSPDVGIRTQETAISAPLPPPAASKVNDVDSYRLNEIERKCDTMGDNLLRLFRELEEQKRILEADHSRKQEEVKKAWEEKKNMKEYYEAQLDKLSTQISQLQSTSVACISPQPANEEIRELVRRQEEEVKRLQEQIETNAAENRVEEIRGLEDVDGLSEELQELRSQLRQQERKHKKSLKEMQESLQRSYEEALNAEKDKLRDMMKDMAQGETPVAVIHKPPPSPKTKPKKPPTPNLATRPSAIPRIDSLPSTPAPQTTREARGTAQQQHRPVAPQHHHMDAEDTESESESRSETDTSYWNQNELKVKPLQITSVGMDKGKVDIEGTSSHNRESSSESSMESVEGRESQTESEVSSESLHLEALLKDNPKLWGQMKDATTDVLASRLASMGIDPSSKSIKTDTLTACLSQLRKDRRNLERKHENFYDLRKRLENEVKMKVDDKIDDVDTDDTQDDRPSRAASGKRSRMLTRMVRNVQSKVKERSRALSSSVSKTGTSVRSGVRDMFLASSRNGDSVHKISGGHGKIEDMTGQGSSEEKSSVASEDDSSSARVEVHHETLRSVKRNLFSGPSMASSSSTHPGHSSGYFDNKTYGEEDEESSTGWESEPEYENMKEEPPKRSNSLHLSLDSADLHSTPRDIWQPTEEPQPIKVKRPTGEKVSDLTRTIEQQLSGRRKSKMAGAVDITKSFEASSSSAVGRPSTSGYPMSGARRTSTPHDPTLSPHELQSASESSNTIGTSMWGSSEVIAKGSGKVKQPRPSTSKVTVHSWDSEEDLDISDLE
ncbi:Zinc finger protein Dzip1 [Portunus trituberculatus]|uniref:Zinc finger protein Dzip1 n=1 Tax=Portunus trituberculatus TaxID=210409 RepID=A0A5B7DGF9_PORTR|nr:Zinc finger protein Dzip1 [Portunus trituberculatus]